MKSLLNFLILMIVFLGENTLHAQIKEKGVTNSIDNQNSFYIDKLKLKEEQALQFIEINANYEKAVEALKSESKSKNYKEKLKVLEQKRDDELKEMLSRKQFKNYIELRREKRKNLQGLIRKSN
jgi:hypothetical protein